MFTNSIMLHASLTSSSCVNSNGYGLGHTCCIRYHTTVDSSHSTSPAVQTYNTLTSASENFPLGTTARNSSSIGKEPVPWCIRILATSSLVSYAEQGIITFTNVLWGHKTVVLVCCTIEWEPDTPFICEGRDTSVTVFDVVKAGTTYLSI